MSIIEWFFNKFKEAEPVGEVEAPTNDKPVDVSPKLHYLAKSFIDGTSYAISRLKQLDELLKAPKVEYVKGFHTKVTMVPIEGLGEIVVIFDSQSGEPICASINKEIESD